MSENTPLFAGFSDHDRDDENESITRSIRSYFSRFRAQTQRFFSSRAKHWIILALILLDVAGILAEIFIALITCELHRQDEYWVAPTQDALAIFALTMSCIFVAELILSVFADGFKFFASWFHQLDAFVILGSFAVDLLQHSIATEIASLIVVLRLWRFVKIVQEFSVEQNEATEALRERIRELEAQVADLEAARPPVE
ncbi:hypothetical protein GGS24DRAFT_174987 [Hypoxylon argillaceum]|nr:hypothetical protein GGS24DRAFT_174987 [Hypoxylon argillaceum]